ncbi:MAG TPA: hypothetical protein VNN79_23730, partial [Actinomycetota bacterium]|nr:hypothetical protein [Actinomycetota bacterium]
MSEKAPKRGILSSLMGLFGDDAKAEAEEQREAQAPAKAAAAQEANRANGAEPEHEAGPASSSHGGNVVRESYEPGWYAVSTARTSRPSFVSEPWGGVPAQRHEEPAAEPVHEPINDPVRETPAGDAAAALRPNPEEIWQARATGTPPIPLDHEPAEANAERPAPIYTDPFALRDPTAVIDPAQAQSWFDPAATDEPASYARPFDDPETYAVPEEAQTFPTTDEASFEPEHTGLSFEQEPAGTSFEPDAEPLLGSETHEASWGTASLGQEQAEDWSAEPEAPAAQWSPDATVWGEPEQEADPTAEAEPRWATPDAAPETESSWAAPEP